MLCISSSTLFPHVSLSVQIWKDLIETQWECEKRCDLCHILFPDWREPVWRKVQDEIQTVTTLVWRWLWWCCILSRHKEAGCRDTELVVILQCHNLITLEKHVLDQKKRVSLHIDWTAVKHFSWCDCIRLSGNYGDWFPWPSISDCLWWVSQSQKCLPYWVIQAHKDRVGGFRATEQTAKSPGCVCKCYRYVTLDVVFKKNCWNTVSRAFISGLLCIYLLCDFV